MSGEAEPRPERFVSVDAFRGAVLALMLLTPATGADGLAWLRHAEWDGMTVSDWLFPTFLVTSGLSLSFLLRRGRPTRATGARLARRLLLLIAAGLAYNAYGASWLDLSGLRFTGVLQMIGIAGACAAAAVLLSRRVAGADAVWWIVGVATVIAVLYGLGLELLSCEPAPRCSPYLSVDAGLLGDRHLYWAGQAGWDPEGIVASVAASSLVLYGYAAGMLLQRYGRSSASETLASIGALAALCFAGGLAVATQWMPPNKRLLTPSFVLLAAGSALAVFCAMYLLTDAARSSRESRWQWHPPSRWRRWNWPFVALGRNALIVFLAERFLLQTARHVHVGGRSVQSRLLEDVLPFGEPGVHVAYTAVLVLMVTAAVGELHRRRWYLAL